MTAPRQVVPGRTYLISRRCTQRQFLLRPEPLVEQIYLYCLGEAAARYGVTLHGWIAMSNHHHLVVRDDRGNYPEFLAHFHKMVAKAMNAHRRRRENFWAAEQPSAVHLVESFDRFSKLVYLLTNPVASDLVDRVSDWPGASSLRQVLSGSTKRVKRPRGFFRDEGPMPAAVELRIERVDGFADLSGVEWADMVLAAIAREERAAGERRRDEGRGVLGRKGILRTESSALPVAEAPPRDAHPTLACRNKERRVLEVGLVRAFRAAYQAALALWRGGERETPFPSGTYRMRWFGVSTSSVAAAA